MAGKAPKKPKRLNGQESRLVAAVASGKKINDAAQEAELIPGGTAESARTKAYRILKRPHVVVALNAALDEAGATVRASAQVIAAGHKASVVKVFHDSQVGKVVYATPLVDHQTRMKAAELNLRARKLIGPGADENAAPPVSVFSLITIIKQESAVRGLPL